MPSPVTSVLDLLAPTRCLVCRRRGELPWCRTCAPGPRAGGPHCPRCDARLGAGRDAGCPLDDRVVARVVAAHDYVGSVATVVRGAKLDGCPAAYPPLGVALADVVERSGVGDDVDVVTSVPVPARRRRRRGFDHAGILARVVARDLGLPYRSVLAVAGRAVDRGAGGPDVGVTRMVARGAVSGHVLLVDDVVTTGATVVTAARALVGAGARRVSVAAVARAGRHGP